MLSLAYTRDQTDRLTTENAKTYSYDGLDRITKAATTGYRYDKADQVTSTLVNGATTSNNTYNANGELTKVVRPTGTTTYVSDPQGNRTTITRPTATTTLTYDQANRMTRYGTSDTYTYNGDGLRTAKTVSGVTTKFVWSLAQGQPLIVSDGATAYLTGPHGLPLEQVNGTTALYYQHDQLGSTRLLTSSPGTIAARYDYDAYGNPTATTGTSLNPFRYAGQYTDRETGYQYLRARYYDPTTQQFITKDPLATLTGAPYTYAGSSPTNATDPTGLDYFDDVSDAMRGEIDSWTPWDLATNAANALGAGVDTCSDAYRAGNGVGPLVNPLGAIGGAALEATAVRVAAANVGLADFVGRTSVGAWVGVKMADLGIGTTFGGDQLYGLVSGSKAGWTKLAIKAAWRAATSVDWLAAGSRFWIGFV